MKSFIGGYYYIDPSAMEMPENDSAFHLPLDSAGTRYDLTFTNLGTTAGVYILQNYLPLTEDDTVLLPDYLCATIVQSFSFACKAKRVYYRINADLSIDLPDLLSKLNDKVKLVYIIHYFGLPQPLSVMTSLADICQKRKIPIMEDITQASFNLSPGRIGIGEYLVSSIRKWFPATDGGLAAIRRDIPARHGALGSPFDRVVYDQLVLSRLRDEYDRHSEYDIALYYKRELACNSQRYIDLVPRDITPMSRKIICGFDSDKNLAARRYNYEYLYELLRDIPQVTLFPPCTADPSCSPFGLMALFEDRDELDSYLRRRRIQGQIQWYLPQDGFTPCQSTQYIYDHNLMLQCDMRFTEENLNAVASAIKGFYSRK